MYVIDQHLRSCIPNMLLKPRSLQKNTHSNFAKRRVPQGIGPYQTNDRNGGTLGFWAEWPLDKW